MILPPAAACDCGPPAVADNALAASGVRLATTLGGDFPLAAACDCGPSAFAVNGLGASDVGAAVLFCGDTIAAAYGWEFFSCCRKWPCCCFWSDTCSSSRRVPAALVVAGWQSSSRCCQRHRCFFGRVVVALSGDPTAVQWWSLCRCCLATTAWPFLESALQVALGADPAAVGGKFIVAAL